MKLQSLCVRLTESLAIKPARKVLQGLQAALLFRMRLEIMVVPVALEKRADLVRPHESQTSMYFSIVLMSVLAIQQQAAY